jgi:hypothetical protein
MAGFVVPDTKHLAPNTYLSWAREELNLRDPLQLAQDAQDRAAGKLTVERRGGGANPRLPTASDLPCGDLLAWVVRFVDVDELPGPDTV